MSGKKRNARLEAIKAACQEYIQGPMLEGLSALLRQTLESAKLNANRARVDPILLTRTVRACFSGIPLRPPRAMRISVALSKSIRRKSALDPHAPVVVKPYIGRPSKPRSGGRRRDDR